MNILLLEDDYAYKKRIKAILEDAGFAVEDFGRIDLAKEFINKNIQIIDCVVLDLNMNDEWLDEFQVESVGGMISGWIFMKRYIYPLSPDMPTVILSGINDIDDIIDLSSYNQVKFLSKDYLYGNKTYNLIDTIKEITI